MTLHPHRPLRLLLVCMLFVCTLGSLAGRVTSLNEAIPNGTATYIVQAASADLAERAVQAAGGMAIQRLAIINGVTATLTQASYTQLARQPQLVLHADQQLQTSDSDNEKNTGQYLLYPAAATNTRNLHDLKVVSPQKVECKDGRVTLRNDRDQRLHRGYGVTVAVVDSGFMQFKSSSDWKFRDNGTLIAENSGRCIVYRDFLPRSSQNGNTSLDNSADQNGHGTHVVSTIADNRETVLETDGGNATPTGVAPEVNLVIARALDKDGVGTYGQVISAIEWIVANKTRYNVKVLNLSLQAPASGPYWADPMNQAVMKAWQAGIVVVAAAGNAGPEAGTITAPGNIPYVITVGAIKSGRYTASTYDELATYSGRGPTESAFAKPDLVVPASRTIAPMPRNSILGVQVAAGRIETDDEVDYKVGSPADDHAYFQLSGTSMAAAEVSGIVALMLQKEPTLHPDVVKRRLMLTATPAIDLATGQPVYSVWEQGAGLVDAVSAVYVGATDRANVGMDINRDLTTTTHYWGYTQWDEGRGGFLLIDPQTRQPISVWDGGTRSWAGGTRSWAGGARSWAGGTRSWAGGTRSWAGSTWSATDSLWAGGTRSWAGSTTKPTTSSASRSELLVNDN